MTKLEDVMSKYEEGFILGAKLSPHQRDLFWEGFFFALKPEHVKLTEEVKALIKALREIEICSSRDSASYIASKALKAFEKQEL